MGETPRRRSKLVSNTPPWAADTPPAPEEAQEPASQAPREPAKSSDDDAARPLSVVPDPSKTPAPPSSETPAPPPPAEPAPAPSPEPAPKPTTTEPSPDTAATVDSRRSRRKRNYTKTAVDDLDMRKFNCNMTHALHKKIAVYAAEHSVDKQDIVEDMAIEYFARRDIHVPRRPDGPSLPRP